MSLFTEIKNIQGSDKQLKDFAHLVGGIFIMLGGLFLWLEKEFYLYLIGIGGILLAIRLIHFKWLAPLYKVWMGLALCMGFVVSRIILTILFFLVITPLAVIMRLFGKEFLDIKFKDGKASYWVKRESAPTKESYEKQF